MAGARISIDGLPSLAAPTAGTLVPVQESGVTRKMLVSVLSDALISSLNAHLTDTVDAHDASAISATPAGSGVDSVTVQGQLGQLATLANSKVSGSGITNIVALTQAAYDALTPKVGTTLYVITS